VDVLNECISYRVEWLTEEGRGGVNAEEEGRRSYDIERGDAERWEKYSRCKCSLAEQQTERRRE